MSAYLSLREKQPASGYIRYAAEVRQSVMNAHPGETFGFISRLIGQMVGFKHCITVSALKQLFQWKALSKDIKQEYCKRSKERRCIDPPLNQL